jgi:hypothetical protein
MATAYEFIGPQEMDYPAWGLRVAPGDVVRLDGRPPSDGNFREATEDAEPTAVAATEPPEITDPETTDPEGGKGGDEPPTETPRQPNLAASAAEWVAYAKAVGVPDEIADHATRAAIIKHFTGGPFLEGVEPPKADEGDGTEHTETEGE